MFIQINKINHHNESGLALIKTEDIVGIKEDHVEPTKLYDEDGNVVSEEPAERRFSLKMATGKTFTIDFNQYQELVNILVGNNQ